MTDPSEPARTRPSANTREEETRDERITAHPDDAPTEEDEEAAARAGSADEESARAYKDAIERGAHQEGEGRLP